MFTKSFQLSKINRKTDAQPDRQNARILPDFRIQFFFPTSPNNFDISSKCICSRLRKNDYIIWACFFQWTCTKPALFHICIRDLRIMVNGHPNKRPNLFRSCKRYLSVRPDIKPTRISPNTVFHRRFPVLPLFHVNFYIYTHTVKTFYFTDKNCLLITLHSSPYQEV